MASYSIESEGGQEMSSGLDEATARRVAQQLANDRGESVYLYEGVGNEPEEIKPEVEVAS